MPSAHMPSALTGAPNPCQLLVIAPDQFAGALAPLIAHKNGTGMSAHLVTFSQILQAADVSTHPLAIKHLIAAAHEHLATRYVMLVGDASTFPVLHRFVRQPDGGAFEGMDGTYNPDDNYYANLYLPEDKLAGFSDWDANNDGKYNEQVWSQSPAAQNPDNVDGYPHVAIGRIPAHTIDDVSNYVQKVIEYEEGLRVSSKDVFSFICDDKLPESQGVCDNIISFGHIETFENAEVRRLYGNPPLAATMPAGWQALNTVDAEESAFASKWVLHIGHGSNTGWVIKLSDGRYVDNDYVRAQLPGRWNLADEYAFPIVLSAGCETGQFLTNAPIGEYRGLNPDMKHWFWFYKDQGQIEDKDTRYASKVCVATDYTDTEPIRFPGIFGSNVCLRMVMLR